MTIVKNHDYRENKKCNSKLDQNNGKGNVWIMNPEQRHYQEKEIKINIYIYLEWKQVYYDINVL